jgi:hypothetical protein
VTAGKSNGGPFVSAALVCEKALHEKDGVISFIRVVDRFVIQGPTDEMPPGSAVKFTVALCLKAGDARGKRKVVLRPEKPSGETMPDAAMQVLFEGDADRGVNVIMEMAFPVDQEGLYWLDALIDTQRITRIPLRIMYRKAIPGIRGI